MAEAQLQPYFQLLHLLSSYTSPKVVAVTNAADFLILVIGNAPTIEDLSLAVVYL